MARAGAFYQTQPDGLTLFGIEGDAPEDMVPSWGPEAQALRAEIDRDRAAQMTAGRELDGDSLTATDANDGLTAGQQVAAAAAPPEPPPPAVPLAPAAPVVQATPVPNVPGSAPAGPPGAPVAAPAQAPPGRPLTLQEQAWAAEGQTAHEAARFAEVADMADKKRRGSAPVYVAPRDPGWQNQSQSIKVSEALPSDVGQGEMDRALGRYEGELPDRQAQANAQSAALDAEARAKQAEADRIREDAAAQAAFRREVQAEYERRIAGVHEQRRAVAERKVDPQRFFAENGVLGNILLAIGAGLTANVPGGGMATIERIIDRDIEEQRRQIDEAGAEADNALADLMRRYGYDIDEASQTLAIMQGQAAASEGQALAAAAGSGEAQARFAAWDEQQRAQLAERQDRLGREMAGKSERSLAQKWDPGQAGGMVGGGGRDMSYKEFRDAMIARGATPDEADRAAGSYVTGQYRRPAGTSTRVVLESGESADRQRVEFDAATPAEAAAVREKQAAYDAERADWDLYAQGFAPGATREQRQEADAARERLSYGGAGKAFGAFNPEQKAAYQADMLPPVYALDEKGAVGVIARGLGVTDEKRRRRVAEMRRAVDRNWAATMSAHSQGRSPRAPEQVKPPAKGQE